MVDDVIGIAECGQNSIKLNSFINAKMEMKKLYFGEAKCHQIHVGNRSGNCPDLKVHETNMTRVYFDRYLGDVLSEDCLNKRNLDAKSSKGLGIITQIMIMLEELCLGHYYFETAVLLRESVFLNGCLTKIEVCYGLTKENINTLETLDKILLRKILSSHSKVCSVSLWLELGLVPIRFLVMGRRVNFLYYILNRPDDDLIKKVFSVQEKYPYLLERFIQLSLYNSDAVRRFLQELDRCLGIAFCCHFLRT